MKTRTKAEQTSLAVLSKNTMEKVDVTFDREQIDQSKLAKLGRYFGSKSSRVIAESALHFVASALMKPGLDLLDLLNYDKLGLIGTLKAQAQAQAGQIVNKNRVKLSIPLWQVAIIASNADDTLPSADSLVMYSLYETLKRVNILFREELNGTKESGL